MPSACAELSRAYPSAHLLLQANSTTLPQLQLLRGMAKELLLHVLSFLPPTADTADAVVGVLVLCSLRRWTRRLMPAWQSCLRRGAGVTCTLALLRTQWPSSTPSLRHRSAHIDSMQDFMAHKCCHAGHNPVTAQRPCSCAPVLSSA